MYYNIKRNVQTKIKKIKTICHLSLIDKNYVNKGHVGIKKIGNMFLYFKQLAPLDENAVINVVSDFCIFFGKLRQCCLINSLFENVSAFSIENI